MAVTQVNVVLNLCLSCHFCLASSVFRLVDASLQSLGPPPRVWVIAMRIDLRLARMAGKIEAGPHCMEVFCQSQDGRRSCRSKRLPLCRLPLVLVWQRTLSGGSIVSLYLPPVRDHCKRASTTCCTVKFARIRSRLSDNCGDPLRAHAFGQHKLVITKGAITT